MASDSALLQLLQAMNLIRPRLRSLSKCSQVSGYLVITIGLLWIPLLVEIWSSHNLKKMLTSELRVPVTQGLLLGRSEVRKVIILILQSFLIQAKRGEAPGCISSGKDPIWPLFKNKTKPKTESLLRQSISLWFIHRKWLPYPSTSKAPFWNIQFHLETYGFQMILWSLCSGYYKACCY